MPQDSLRAANRPPTHVPEFVRVIAENRTEYLAWRVSAATILGKLGRDGEATGPGPEWPLGNVVLVS
ncbi:hypothetical protein [Mesorhizobium sp.]|uniref:hypothetical protein n=1 Tax=Mesorhizobium sp. TaxID=1871066 RepID=UPI00257D19BB|nr:hypothetical protein [Mesorhizobium sp.]